MAGKNSHDLRAPADGVAGVPEIPDGRWISLLLRQARALARRNLRADAEELYGRAVENAEGLLSVLLEAIADSPRGHVPYAPETVGDELSAADELERAGEERRDSGMLFVALELRIAALLGSGQLRATVREIHAWPDRVRGSVSDRRARRPSAVYRLS